MEFSRVEERLIAALVDRGNSYAVAAVAVLMYTRRHCRKLDPLIDVALRGYPGLENSDTIRSAVTELISRGWITEVTRHGELLIESVAAFPEMLGSYLGDGSAASLLTSDRDDQCNSVELLGSIREPTSERQFRSAVDRAQRFVKLPMFATPARFEGVENLVRRAQAGVHVNVLLFSPKLVLAVRGETYRERVRESRSDWEKLSREYGNIHVRIAYRAAALSLAASSSIDGVRTQIAVYDTIRERSQDSQVISIHKAGYTLNLTTIFEQVFDAEWSLARPISGFRRRLLWYGRQSYSFVLAIASIVALFASDDPRLQNLFAGLSIALLPAMIQRAVLLWPSYPDVGDGGGEPRRRPLE